MPPGGIQRYREVVTSPATASAPWAEPPQGYLDAVGGQPLLPAARQAWLAAVEQGWSDPARLHHQGRRAGLILDAARTSLAAAWGQDRSATYLTSSGPTAVAVAVAGLLDRTDGPRRAIVSAVESLAVLHPVRAHADQVAVVPVDAEGRIDLCALEEALRHPAALVAVQAASPEVGTRQPLADVHALTRQAGVPLLVHAIQTVGRGPMPAHWDLLAASARDWAGPAGVGVLAVSSSVPWTPQESPDRGWVGGFPDIASAAAAATALETLGPWIDREAERAFTLVDHLRTELPRVADGLAPTGDPTERLPHIATFSCEGVVGEEVVHALSRQGFSLASGSACTSDARMPSQVIAAMGVRAETSLRISLPYGCSATSVEALITAMPEVLSEVRR